MVNVMRVNQCQEFFVQHLVALVVLDMQVYLETHVGDPHRTGPNLALEDCSAGEILGLMVVSGIGDS